MVVKFIEVKARHFDIVTIFWEIGYHLNISPCNEHSLTRVYFLSRETHLIQNRN
jgi:hypothetical protein